MWNASKATSGTLDAYECLDLSDNDLIKLDNFPPLKRLGSLFERRGPLRRIPRVEPEEWSGVAI